MGGIPHRHSRFARRTHRAVPLAFIEYLRGDESRAVSAVEGRASVEMVLGAYQSAREGRRVLFPL